jgi:CheY-like chemotaxis protein
VRSKTVLIVEQDSAALENGCSVLEQNGYQVLQARSTQQALEVWSWNSEEIDVALVDEVMPDIKGLELVAENSTSSHGSDPVNSLIANAGANYLIFRRPFDLTIFLQMTSNLVDISKSAARDRPSAA